MRRLLLLSTTVFVAIALAACASPPTADEDAAQVTEGAGGSEGEVGGDAEGAAVFDDVLAQVEGLEGQERIDKLAELAAEEGELSLYTSMTTDFVDTVSSAFEDTFDLDVSVYRAGSETVLQRLIQEANANFHGADIVETNGPEMFALTSEEILAPYEPSGVGELIEGSHYDTWTATRFNNFVISWNTKKVSEDERPQSWEELADPKWDGRMAMETADVDWYKTLWEFWVNEDGKSPEEADQLFEDMADGALLVKGHTVSGELLAAGEYDVFASNYSYLVQELVDEGAPVAWEPPVEPIITRPNGVGLVKNAPHPATALLFYEWILSEEGQKVVREFGLDPSMESLATSGSAELIQVDLPDLQANLDEWTKRYEALIQRGEEVEGGG